MEPTPDPAHTPPPILCADRRFVVLNKPPGLPAHAGPRGGPSAEDWFPQLSRRAEGPWLAHRLDADTAGCLLIALRKTGLIEAQALFAAGKVEKTYWAIAHGRPPAGSGRAESRLARHSDKRGWRMIADPAGQPAITDWRLLGGDATMSWIELRPRTGRTHQLRVHCAALGCPILGDPIYGSASAQAGHHRLHLLAQHLEVPLDPPITATAPPPPHMHEALARCGWHDAA